MDIRLWIFLSFYFIRKLLIVFNNLKTKITKMLAHDEKLSYGNTGMLGATMNPMMELYAGKHA